MVDPDSRFYELLKRWPLAYADCQSNVFIDLGLHLSNTARVAVLFIDEIQSLAKSMKYLSNVQGGEFVKELHKFFNVSLDLEEVFKDILILTALLHDLGKANIVYLENMRNRSDSHLSFRLHEYVTSALLAYIAYAEHDETLKNMLKIVAWAVSRHHMAMKNRDLCRATYMAIKNEDSKSFILELEKYIARLPESKSYLLKTLSDISNTKHCGTLCKKVIDSIKNLVNSFDENKQMDKNRINSASQGVSQTLCSYIQQIRYRHGKIAYQIYRLGIPIAGFIMISDNIAASYLENRTPTDVYIPQYVDSWVRELKYKLNLDYL